MTEKITREELEALKAKQLKKAKRESEVAWAIKVVKKDPPWIHNLVMFDDEWDAVEKMINTLGWKAVEEEYCMTKDQINALHILSKYDVVILSFWEAGRIPKGHRYFANGSIDREPFIVTSSYKHFAEWFDWES